jgi:hypothetical protein
MLAIRFVALFGPGGQLGESGEYRMGRVRVVCSHIWSSEGGSPACVDWGLIVWPRGTRLIMYWRIWDLWGSANLVSSTVTELDDTDLASWMYNGRVFGPPMDAHRSYHMEDSTGARLDPAQLFHSHRERWSLVVPSWLTSVVLSGYFPCKVYIDSKLHDTLRYGWCLFAVVIP